MRDRAMQINEALARLSDAVAEQLVSAGWQRRMLDDYATTLTLTRPNGVLSVTQILRTGFRWPADWPVEVKVRLGIGYEAALNLMPLLTLPPRAILIDDLENGMRDAFMIALDAPDAVRTAAQQIVRFVGEHSGTQAEGFADAAAIESHLRRSVPVATPSTEDDDPGPSAPKTQRRLVLLAAMGRHDEARALLSTYPTRDGKSIARRDRRFVRQLTRWLDAGGPVAPPAEETLARLPQRPRPVRPIWATARAKSKLEKGALNAARALSKGKNRDQLKELIAREYAARGLEISESSIEFKSEQLQLEQWPFGRVLAELKGVGVLIHGGRDVVRGIRNQSAEEPAWLGLPNRASYPMISAGRESYTAVELDADAGQLLDRLRAVTTQRLWRFVLINVWLSRSNATGSLVLHIGEQRVGTIRDEDVARFDRVLGAAAMFDEDPFVLARFLPGDSSRRDLLELPLPAA